MVVVGSPVVKMVGDNLVVEFDVLNDGNVDDVFAGGASIGSEIDNNWHDVDIYNDGKGNYELKPILPGQTVKFSRSMTVPNDPSLLTESVNFWDVRVAVRDKTDPDNILFDEFTATALLSVENFQVSASIQSITLI